MGKNTGVSNHRNDDATWPRWFQGPRDAQWNGALVEVTSSLTPALPLTLQVKTAPLLHCTLSLRRRRRENQRSRGKEPSGGAGGGGLLNGNKLEVTQDTLATHSNRLWGSVEGLWCTKDSAIVSLQFFKKQLLVKGVAARFDSHRRRTSDWRRAVGHELRFFPTVNNNEGNKLLIVTIKIW